MGKSKALYWVGWVLTGLMGLVFIGSATMKFLRPPEFVKTFTEQFGYPESTILPIALIEVTCVVLYLFPRTTVLGAVLLTGYLGGAITTHMRVNEPPFLQFVFGVVVWAGVFLREPRLWALMPWRQSPPAA